MSEVAFRNVEGSPEDPVAVWPYEALVAVLERGGVRSWRPVLAEVRRQPWGPVARRVEQFVAYSDDAPLVALLRRALKDARTGAEERERRTVAEQVRRCIDRSGLNAAEFAARIGTSASRLSTYRSGKVTPSAALMVRMESCADDAQREALRLKPGASGSPRTRS